MLNPDLMQVWNNDSLNLSAASDMVTTYNTGGDIMDVDIITNVCPALHGLYGKLAILYLISKGVQGVTGILLDLIPADHKAYKIGAWIHDKILFHIPSITLFGIMVLVAIQSLGLVLLKKFIYIIIGSYVAAYLFRFIMGCCKK